MKKLTGLALPMMKTLHSEFCHGRIWTAAARFLMYAALSVLSFATGWADTGKKNYLILQPVNTSSPKATLRTFLVNANQAYKEFQRAGYRTKDAMKYMDRAASTLNLSRVPKTMRDDIRFESTLRLKEIIDHIEMPALDAVPGTEDFRDKEAGSWRIPRTDITIARVSEGPREGAWLFTAETVARIDDYYKLLEEFLGADGTTQRIYEEYIYSPGWMIPVHFIKALPTWLRKGYFEQALWQWISLFVAVAFGTVMLRWARHAANWLQTKAASDSRRWQWERLLYPIFALIFVYALLYFVDEQINITGDVLNVVEIGMKAVIFIFAAWMVIIFGDLVSEGIGHAAGPESTSIAADVTRLLIRVLSYMVIFLIFYRVPDRFGIPVGAVFASAGIAGFAVALAAKDSLSNFFGGLTIFMDRPFQRGDFIVLNNNERGEVIQIGIRSTRIQTRDDVMITIPNSMITNAMVVNQSSPKPMFRIRLKFGVAYGSDIRQVQEVALKQALANPLAAEDPEPQIRFQAFGEWSLNFELLCWAKRPQDQGSLMHGLNSSLYEAFNVAGIEIPYPQRVVHINEEKDK